MSSSFLKHAWLFIVVSHMGSGAFATQKRKEQPAPTTVECRLLSEDIDLALLRKEFETIKHLFIPRDKNSNLWHGIALKNALGTTDARGLQLYISIKNNKMEICYPSAHLEKAPYIKALLERIEQHFGAQTGLVRIFRLPSENAVPPHQDGDVFHFARGKVFRLHIPIITTPDVRFIINGKAYFLEPGKLYFTNVSLMHSVINDSDADRVHLIIDVHANDAFRTFIRNAQEPAFVMHKK